MRTRYDGSPTEGPRHWRPSQQVTWCSHGDIVVVLSLHSERYFTLDATGTRMWIHVCEKGLSTDDAAIQIAQEFGMDGDPRVIRQDIDAFMTELRARYLVEPYEPDVGHLKQAAVREADFSRDTVAAPRVHRLICTLATCLVSLAAVHILLKVIGLERTLRRIDRKRARQPSARLSESSLRDAARTVRVAATIYPLRTACLEQSLCLLWVLRRSGVDAALRLGVAPFPFRAHAWVEYFGTPVNEDSESLAAYRILPDVLTR